MQLPRLNPTIIETLAAELIAAATHAAISTRYLLGIAGIPGSGKSTLAAQLLASINHHTGNESFARLVPMDGFHFTNEILDAMNLRDRKGSPETFDALQFIALLTKAKRDCTSRLSVPIYDRTLHEPVPRADESHAITPATRLIIAEGNYLLLDEPPWSQLAEVLDACWFLQTDAAQAEAWIIARHMRGGRSEADAIAHYERCDLSNALRICSHRRQADRVLQW